MQGKLTTRYSLRRLICDRSIVTDSPSSLRFKRNVTTTGGLWPILLKKSLLRFYECDSHMTTSQIDL